MSTSETPGFVDQSVVDVFAGVTAYLTVDDAAAAVAYYGSAFGAVERPGRLTAPNGKIMHTMMDLFGSVIMLADEYPDMQAFGPTALGGTPVKLNLQVPDAEAVCDSAVAAGGELLIPVAEQFYGHMAGRLRDPFGHLWIITTPIEVLSPEEMQQRFSALFDA